MTALQILRMLIHWIQHNNNNGITNMYHTTGTVSITLAVLSILNMPLPLWAESVSVPPETTAQSVTQSTTITKSDTDTVSVCKKGDANCTEPEIEHVQVIGRYINPISLDSQGSYTLDKDMLRAYRFGNGNLNDILGVLPGVQYSEESYAADQVSNIKPGEVSIAGAAGHQSGYFIDGVNNNSRLSSDHSMTDSNLMQDIVGHSQETFINLNLLDHVEVYDSNIPAEYGQFSGGLVKAKTRNAGKTTEWGLNYRYTSDSFITFNKFYSPDYDKDELNTPTFDKQDINAYFTTPIGSSAGFLSQIQLLRSKETKLQLGDLKPQEQTNYNILLKYHQDISPKHYLAVSAFYAPYTGKYFDTYAINSGYEIKGGGYSAIAEWRYEPGWANIETLFAWRSSENSKSAPDYRFNWRNITGKSWGDYNGSFSSLEGGFGDIEKTQQTVTVKQNYHLPEFRFFAAQNTLKFGGEIQWQQSVFERLNQTTIYNGAVVNANINCNAYLLDCVETQFYRPVSEIEAELGRPLNLADYNDMQLYSDNILQAGQYFQTRQVAPKSKADVSLNTLALYMENQSDWSYVRLTVGVRYDYNDFFKQHNFAPRIRLAYDIFNNNNTVLVAGANRYYEADLLSYKLNGAIEPFYQEYRRTSQNLVLNWEAALLNRGYRTEYNNTKTPFSDEINFAVRQQLLGGTLEAKWLKRKNKDSIDRTKGFNALGEAIMYATNNGSSEYERYSLSWMARFNRQHVEMNISHASNVTNRNSFDGTTTYYDGNGVRLNFNYDDNELVFLRQTIPNPSAPEQSLTVYNLVTRHDLSLEKQDFNRPVIFNLSWGLNWSNWYFSAHAKHQGSQEAVYSTGLVESLTSSSSICSGCVPNRNEYPVYLKEDRPGFWLMNASLRYDWFVTANHKLTFSIDAENIFNGRTYQISQYATGTELGRRFWLGVSYQH